MLVKDYIAKEFLPARLTDSSTEVLERAVDFQFNHIPVIQGLEYVGAIPIDVIRELENDSQLSDFQFDYHKFSILENTHILESPKFFELNQTNLLPVLNEEGHYLGYFSSDEFIAALDYMPWSSEPGHLILVKTTINKYSASEIAQIVESNNARLLGFFITDYENDNLLISVKINQLDSTTVIQSFERFGYEVLSRFEDNQNDQLFSDRYDQLMRYLEI